MFRYKTNLASKSLADHHSKSPRRGSSSSSSGSKDGMDPSKDSWVFSKDGSDHRKSHEHRHHHHHHNKRRSSPDLTSSEIDEESLSDGHSSSTNEGNMKVNVFYRGMVYKFRGLKVFCSIISGIILLLTAVVILGIWIILGANEDGTFYFPWSSFSSANETTSTDVINSNVNEILKAENILTKIESELLTSKTKELINFKIPPKEVEETLGHFQAVTPRLASDYTSEIYDSEYYYDDYEDGDYYSADARVDPSIISTSAVDAPPGFLDYIPRDYDYEMEPQNEGEDSEPYGNDFRVYIGEESLEEGDDSKKISRPVNSFSPSPLIPEFGVSNSEFKFIAFDDAGERVIKVTDSPNIPFQTVEGSDKNSPMRPLTNSDLIPAVFYPKLLDNTEEIDQPEIINKNKEANKMNNHRYVDFEEEIIENPPIDRTMNYEEPTIFYNEDISHLTRDHMKEPSLPAQQDHFKNGEGIIDSRLYFESANPRYEDLEPDNESDHEDPHRKLFIGKYDSSQIIFEPSDNRKRFLQRQVMSYSPNFNNRERNSRPNQPAGYIRNDDFMSQIPREQNLPPNMRNGLLRQRLIATRNRALPPPSPPIQKRPIQVAFPGPRMGNDKRVTRLIAIRKRPVNGGYMTPPKEYPSDRDSQIAESMTRSPTVVRVDGSPVLTNRNPSVNSVQAQQHFGKPVSHRFRNNPRHPTNVQTPPPTPFFGALQNMYDYSRRLASSLISLPNQSEFGISSNSSGDFLENSFGLLKDYDNVFQSLPRALTDPLKMLQLPTADQVDHLNPFQLSLMTWTFIDFWEFLIEKVGTLSRQDLQILETRLEKIREQKDSSFARSFISSGDNNNKLNVQLNTTFKSNETENSLETILLEESAKISPETRGPLNYFNTDEQVKLVQYAIKTLFNFGKVYLKSDYAMDCMMLLFCKDINANTKVGGLDGMAAKLKSVGLKVLVDKEGREADTVNSVWQALTKWEPLQCETMFPKCDGSKALEIVNEVANASRK